MVSFCLNRLVRDTFILVFSITSTCFAEMIDTPWIIPSSHQNSLLIQVSEAQDWTDAFENIMAKELDITVKDCKTFKVAQRHSKKGLEIVRIFSDQLYQMKKFSPCTDTDKVTKKFRLYPLHLNCEKNMKQTKWKTIHIFDAETCFRIKFQSACASGPIVPEHSVEPFSRVSKLEIKRLSSPKSCHE